MCVTLSLPAHKEEGTWLAVLESIVGAAEGSAFSVAVVSNQPYQCPMCLFIHIPHAQAEILGPRMDQAGLQWLVRRLLQTSLNTY